MNMEPTVGSETSAIRTQTSGNYPKRNKLHSYYTFNIFEMTEKIMMDTQNSSSVYVKIQCPEIMK